MGALTARPKLLKQANLSSIRRVLKSRGTATRAEIAGETKISSTTVRSLLSEMMQNGELESTGRDPSSGGRKAERYRLNPHRCHSAALCMGENRIRGLLVNIYGEIVEESEVEIWNGDLEAAAFRFLDDLIPEKDIRSIGVGVPGVVERGCYRRKNERGELCQYGIGEHLAERYAVPVIMENDLNAAAIGFGRLHVRDFSPERREGANLAYLYFEKTCVSAGLVAEGRVIRGCRNFAGEVGLIPSKGGRTLCERILEAADDAQYVSLLVELTGFICGILNPRYVILSGPAFRPRCMARLRGELSELLLKPMSPDLLFSPDVWRDYCEGMARLTAEQMFDEVQFIRERPL